MATWFGINCDEIPGGLTPVLCLGIFGYLLIFLAMFIFQPFAVT
jgi:hypothetical protein